MTNAGRSRFIASQGGLPVVLYPTDQFPTIASIPKDAVVYDSTDGVVKQKRQVGNLTAGSTSVAVDYVLNTAMFNANLDFQLNIIFRQKTTDPVPYSGLFCCSVDGSPVSQSRGIWIERDNLRPYYVVRFYNNVGASRVINTIDVIDGKYHSLLIKRTANLLTFFIDGFEFGNLSLADFLVNNTSFNCIGSQTLNRNIDGQIAKVKLANGAASFEYNFSEGSGAICHDLSGNGNNGTITDGAPNSFWDVQDLVPLSLLS